MMPFFLTILGFVGFAASILIYFGTFTLAFIHPLNNSPYDLMWAAAYAVLILIGGFLYWKQYYRLLLRLIAWCGGLFLLVIFLVSPNAKALLTLIWLVLIALGMGDWLLTHWLHLDAPRFDRLLLSFGLGMGGLSLIVTSLASISFFEGIIPALSFLPRLLFTWPVLVVLILLTVLFTPAFIHRWFIPILDHFRKLESSKLPLFTGVVGLGAILVVGPLLWALAPSIRYDSLMYHLSVPEIYVRNRGMIPIPEAFNSYWAHYAEMLYTLALLTAGQPLPGLMHLSFGLAATGMTFSFSRKIAGSKVAWIAGMLFASTPIIGYEAGTAYIDLFLTFYIVSVYYGILTWWQTGKPTWLVISGLLAGFALGIKMNAAVILLPLGIVLLCALIMRYRSAMKVMNGLFRFGIPALILLSPWLVRDYLWTGNPVFPMFNSIFRSPLWVKEYDIFSGSSTSTSLLLRLLSLPVTLITQSNRTFYREGPNASLGILPLLGLPWFYLTSSYLTRNLRRWGAGLFIFLALSFFVSGHFSLLARYLLPLFPLLALLSALNVHTLWLLLERSRGTRWIGLAFLLLSMLYIGSSRVLFTLRGWQILDRYPVGAALGFEPQDQFLTRAISVYPALQYLNRLPENQVDVLSIGNESLLYTTTRIHSPFISMDAAVLLEQEYSPEKLAEVLLSKGFDYILVDQEMVRRYNLEYYNVLQEDFLRQYTRLIFAWDDKVFVYKILAEPKLAMNIVQEPPPGKNILANGGFEESGSDTYPLGWERFGSPMVDLSGGQSFEGRVAVEAVGGQAFWFQQTRIIPDVLYTLGFWVRADQEGQVARLQIVWRDDDLRQVRVSSRIVEAGNQWQWYQFSATAPLDARLARVYATAQEGSLVWIDSVCFAEGETCTP